MLKFCCSIEYILKCRGLHANSIIIALFNKSANNTMLPYSHALHKHLKQGRSDFANQCPKFWILNHFLNPIRIKQRQCIGELYKNLNCHLAKRVGMKKYPQISSFQCKVYAIHNTLNPTLVIHIPLFKCFYQWELILCQLLCVGSTNTDPSLKFGQLHSLLSHYILFLVYWQTRFVVIHYE